MSWMILLTLFSKFVGLGLVIIILVSYANKTILELSFVICGKSLMQSRKGSGPSIDPWGTPYVISPQFEHKLEEWLFKTTLWYLPQGKI